MRPYFFIDKHGRRWDAPKGHWINGANIPRLMWAICGGPYTGRYRKSSVMHDVYCDS
ncbi:DUF1353 domain-containing protein, partial [PVC group bacterium]|nr:DUF1353 domain-containing protein [PVC group bacterium]